MTNLEWQQRWDANLLNNYGTPPITLVSGRGATVIDADGREYIDLLAGIAVNALGHAHPAVIAAVTNQLATLGHTSNLAISRPTVELAERLLGHAGRSGRVFFCNSGAEANEAAIKIARATGRTGIIAAEGSFHGRTAGALSITGQASKREPFEPLLPDVTFVPYGDIDATAAATTDTTSAIFLETIQGEGGVVVPPPGYLQAAQDVAHEVGALFVIDEVQTGIGRTGDWFAHTELGLKPDVVTLAKGLGGGLPIGATIAFGEAAKLLGPGSHGSTFGGNPVTAAAALAVLDTIENENLLQRVKELSEELSIGLLSEGAALVSAVRGSGLLLGAVLDRPLAREVEAAARECGLLINAVRPDVIRIAPPLVLTDAELAMALDRFGQAVNLVAGTAGE
jgi:acetylornithine/N-succinyldiaminopimelate aminotransferase